MRCRSEHLFVLAQYVATGIEGIEEGKVVSYRWIGVGWPSQPSDLWACAKTGLPGMHAYDGDVQVFPDQDVRVIPGGGVLRSGEGRHVDPRLASLSLDPSDEPSPGLHELGPRSVGRIDVKSRCWHGRRNSEREAFKLSQ